MVIVFVTPRLLLAVVAAKLLLGNQNPLPPRSMKAHFSYYQGEVAYANQHFCHIAGRSTISESATSNTPWRMNIVISLFTDPWFLRKRGLSLLSTPRGGSR